MADLPAGLRPDILNLLPMQSFTIIMSWLHISGTPHTTGVGTKTQSI